MFDAGGVDAQRGTDIIQAVHRLGYVTPFGTSDTLLNRVRVWVG
jgi:hypothetical protein